MRASLVLLVLLVACKSAPDPAETTRATEGSTEVVPEPPAPGSEPPPEPDPLADPVAEACFLGEFGDGTACFGTFELSASARGYDYPPPLQGSVQYTAPVRFLDLLEIDGATRLAPNFQLDEIATPSRSRFAVVQAHAVERLQAIRDEVGVLEVNSGYRSPGYNASIPGSARWSRHQYGDGFDLDPASVSLQALAEACEEEGAGYVEVYVSHVHCDWRDDRLDPAFYDALRGATFTVTPARDAAIARRGSTLRAVAEGFDEGEPLRVWTAYDADGRVLVEATGPAFDPPAEAAEVRVTVGRVIDRRVTLRAR